MVVNNIQNWFKKIVFFLKTNRVQTIRATDLPAWVELQISSKDKPVDISLEQEKISELIRKHLKQVSTYLFEVEDSFKEISEIMLDSVTGSPSLDEEFTAIVRELKNLLHYLKELFPEDEVKKKDVSVRKVDMGSNSLIKIRRTIKELYKKSLQELSSKVLWQDGCIKLLEELHRLESALNSVSKVLEQSKTAKFGPILELASRSKQLTSEKAKINENISKIVQRKEATLASKSAIEEELRQIEESPKFQEINNLQEEEDELNKEIEKIEDKLFVFCGRLKDCLSDLADLNSDYELLSTIQHIEILQEEPLEFFSSEFQEKLGPQLNWILSKLASQSLESPEDPEYSFEELFNQMESETMRILKEQYQMLFEQKRDLPNRKMQHPIYANAQNLRYKRDHYISQVKKLDDKINEHKDQLGLITSKAIQYKMRFEKEALELFEKKVEVELR